MKKDDEKNTVIKILQGFGFNAFEIPEEPQKGRRADIRAIKDAQSFLIEVKTKDDHPNFKAALKEAEDLEIVEYEKPLRRSNTFGKIIREGAKQLEETPDDAQSFKCIWFRAIEALFTDELKFMKSTLYGIEHLIVIDQLRCLSAAECFFFNHSEFFNNPSLDGVVLDNGSVLELCVNSFSKRYDTFRNSVLYNIFESSRALTDPLMLEGQREILVANTDVQRKDKDAVIKFIQDKYGVYVNLIEMKSIGAAVLYTLDDPHD